MKKIIIIIALFIIGFSTFAQGVRTNYFLDKYTHNHVLNPALSPRSGYIYIPGAGGPHYVGVESNLKLSQFLYPLDNGDLGTFLHPDVSSDEFLSKIKNRNKMSIDANIGILSFGFYVKDKFFTFDVNVKANTFFNIPKDFFAFVKEGMQSPNESYNFKDMSIGVDAYAEVALGYSQDINKNWRVGGKLKILSGAASGLFEIENMSINMSADQWMINTKTSASLLGAGFILEKDSVGAITGIDYDSPGPGGWGAGIDLGAVYTFDEDSPLSNFKLSLAVTDLGFIRYKKQNVLKAANNGQVIFDGFNGIGIDNDSIYGFDETIEKLKDDLLDMTKVREVESAATTRYLKAKMNFGIEYSFLKDKMSLGLLSTTHFGLPGTTTELTLSVNARPVKWFSAAVSTSFLHGLNSVGVVMNITPKYGLNLFFGVDHLFFEMTPQYVPVNMARVNAYFGLSIPLGGNAAPKYRKNKMDVDTSMPNSEVSLPSSE